MIDVSVDSLQRYDHKSAMLGIFGLASVLVGVFVMNTIMDDDEDAIVEEENVDDFDAEQSIGEMLGDLLNDEERSGQVVDHLDSERSDQSAGLDTSADFETENLVGTDENDFIEGTHVNETLEGGEGDDTLRGGGGSGDMLVGGSGDDLLINGQIGTNGFLDIDARGGFTINDVTYREAGALFGGEGNDTILAVQGDVFGGPGDDSLSNFDKELIDSTSDNDQSDHVGIISFGDINTNSSLHGGEGDDEILAIGAEAFGEDGDDTIYGSGFDQFDDIGGQNFTSQSTTLSGGDGNDVIYGLAAHIEGGAGDDLLGGRYSDMFGGDGEDTILVDGSGLDEGDSLVVDGGSGDDVIAAVDGNYESADGMSKIEFKGGDGDDLIDARVSSDNVVIDPGSGADTIVVEPRYQAVDDYQGMTIIEKFDFREDLLIIDVPVVPNKSLDDVDTLAEVKLEVLPGAIDGEVGAFIKLAISPGTEFELQEVKSFNNTTTDAEPEARFVFLSGVDPEDVEVENIFTRAVFEGSIMSKDGFPSLEDDTTVPNLLLDLPSTGFDGFPTLNLNKT